MMKDCGATAGNIVGAMVERLEASGDATHLEIQNLQPREDLAEAKRKAERQDKEIDDLRRAVIRLEGEVNALKEGCGPYAQVNTVSKDNEKHSIGNMARKQQTPRIKQSKDKNVDYNFHSTQGCSKDAEYMSRKDAVDDQWPLGPDTMDWAISIDADEKEITEGTKKNDTDKSKYDTNIKQLRQ